MNRLTLPLVAMVLVAPRPVQAQDTVALPDLQVTATRVPASPATVPAAITVISGDELRARGVTWLMDALRDVPGVEVAQSGTYGTVTSLFLRGGESDYTKVLIDGVTMNSPGGAINLANLPLDDIDRIEVVAGPGSVLYGADAISGTVQIFTRRGELRPSGTLEARAGTFGSQDLRGRLAGGSGPFRISAAGSHFSSDGIYEFNSRFVHSDGSAVLSWLADADTRVDLTARYNAATGHFPNDGNGDPVDHNQRTIDGEWMLGLSASHRVSSLVQLRLEGWSHRLDSDFRDEADNAADSVGFGFAGSRDALLTRRGVTIHADWRLRPTLHLMTGVALEREAEEQGSVTRSNFGTGPTDDTAQFSADRNTRSVFAQLRALPVAGLDLQLGGRLDHNSAFGSFVTGRAGLVYHLSPAARVWTSVGTGFKAPTFGELFAASPYEVGNPDLEPEQSRSVEAGVALEGQRTSLRLTAFHQRFTDLIQYLSASPGEPSYGNLGAARSNGLEATLAVRPSRVLSLRAHLAWIDTEVTDTGAVSSATFREGEALLRRPAWSGGITLMADLAPVRLSATGRWVGERVDVSFRDFPATRTLLPSYGVVDAAVQIPVVSTGRMRTELLLRAENLFDASWDQMYGYPGRGRTLLGGARLTF